MMYLRPSTTIAHRLRMLGTGTDCPPAADPSPPAGCLVLTALPSALISSGKMTWGRVARQAAAKGGVRPDSPPSDAKA